ncbi:MAG: hypothetical protein QW841_04760 [Candidatus Aenigmatarchaeota archaeon]
MEKDNQIPNWLKESLKNTLLFEFMVRAFEEKCDCKICQDLRETAKSYQEFTEKLIKSFSEVTKEK